MFCENCGSRLASDAQFCENCGVKLQKNSGMSLQIYAVDTNCSPIPPETMDARTEALLAARSFSTPAEWQTIVRKQVNAPSIMLINTAHCPDPVPFLRVLLQYISHMDSQGVSYYVFDLAKTLPINQAANIENIMPVLRELYAIALPRHLLIVGDRQSIGSAKWDNKADDSDQYVTSDLPFVTGSLRSPWDGVKYDFRRAVAVGRIPARAEDNFYNAVDYFDYVLVSRRPFVENIRSFGISAEAWTKVSKKIYTSIFSSKDYYVSPPYRCDDFKRKFTEADKNTPNILYFNLHGSNNTSLWYGEDSRGYPEAFSPQCLKDMCDCYIIATEACYGAKVTYDPQESILIYAMQRGCRLFLGSTEIAYGTSENPGSCADVVVSEFLNEISKGTEGGKAYLLALSKLTASEMDDTEIKTLAEFALYGDPSHKISCRSNAHSFQKSAGGLLRRSESPIQEINARLEEILSSTGCSIDLKLAQMSAELSDTLQKHIAKDYSHFAGITPRYYKINGYDGYQAIYSRKNGEIHQVLKVYLDSQGKIRKTYVSK